MLWFSSESVCLYLFPKDRKIRSGEYKKRGEGRFAPKTENDPNEDTQKETVTKELSGKRIQLKVHLFWRIIATKIIELHWWAVRGHFRGGEKRDYLFQQRGWGQWPDVVAPSSFKAAEDIWTALTVMDIIRVWSTKKNSKNKTKQSTEMWFLFVNKIKIRPARECNQENNWRGDWISYTEVKILNIQVTH